MSELFIFAKDALPSVASSPLALIAYLAIVLCWGIIAWKVKRNKNLLTSLDKLPEKDRLKALEMEMGAVRVQTGLTAEQWLRSLTRKYILAGLAIICLTIVLIVILSTLKAKKVINPEVSLAVANYYQDQEVQSDEFKGLEGQGGFVHYHYSYVGDVLHVSPSGYLRQVKEGLVVRDSDPDLKVVNSPYLTYKLANNTDRVLLVSEVKFEVESSVPDREPVPVVHGNNRGELFIGNIGWSDGLNPDLYLGIAPSYVCMSNEAYRVESIKNIPVVEHMKLAKLTSKIETEAMVGKVIDTTPSCGKQQYYREDCEYVSVCLYGVLSYFTSEHKKKAFRFVSNVSYVPPPKPVSKKPKGPSAYSKASRIYDVALAAGTSGHTIYLPVSHELKPGESDRFDIKVTSDVSATYKIKISVLDSGGNVIHEKRAIMSIYAPPVFYAGTPIKFYGRDYPIKRGKVQKKTDNERIQLAGKLGNGLFSKVVSDLPKRVIRTDQEIQAIFKKNTKRLNAIYIAELRKNPQLNGTWMLFKITIEPDGSVSHSHIEASNFDSAYLQKKVIDQFKIFNRNMLAEVRKFNFGKKPGKPKETVYFKYQFSDIH